MSHPTISVILPVYNGENYLRFAIESVLDQTFKDFELIVIDDGSKDSTPEIARSYGEQVRYVHQENTGVAGAFNHGLRLAAGRYISWLSHDDIYLPEKLEKQLAALTRIGELAVCYGDVQIIDSTGSVIGDYETPEYDRDQVLRHVVTGGPVGSACYSIMYDRRCIDEVGQYSEYWQYTQDAEMLARLTRRFPLVRIPEALVQVREHEERGVRSVKWEREALRYFKHQLRSIPLEELFPELGVDATRSDRGLALEWLGAELMTKPYPIYLAALTQFRRAALRRPRSAFRLWEKVRWVIRRYLKEDSRWKNSLPKKDSLRTNP